jgi:hypothetical protein
VGHERERKRKAREQQDQQKQVVHSHASAREDWRRGVAKAQRPCNIMETQRILSESSQAQLRDRSVSE